MTQNNFGGIFLVVVVVVVGGGHSYYRTYSNFSNWSLRSTVGTVLAVLGLIPKGRQIPYTMNGLSVHTAFQFQSTMHCHSMIRNTVKTELKLHLIYLTVTRVYLQQLL